MELSGKVIYLMLKQGSRISVCNTASPLSSRLRPEPVQEKKTRPPRPNWSVSVRGTETRGLAEGEEGTDATSRI